MNPVTFRLLDSSLTLFGVRNTKKGTINRMVLVTEWYVGINVKVVKVNKC